MRIAIALLPMLLGVLLLAGCGKPAAATYTLSAEDNSRFLADNGKRSDVKTTASGLQYRVITAGHGARVTGPGDIVTVRYRGWTIDGHVFDQTQPGQTAQFPAGGLIPGWVEALKLMQVGDKWQLVIPPDLGYGSEGAGADIPPNQTLVFDMELVAVNTSTP